MVPLTISGVVLPHALELAIVERLPTAPQQKQQPNHTYRCCHILHILYSTGQPADSPVESAGMLALMVPVERSSDA